MFSLPPLCRCRLSATLALLSLLTLPLAAAAQVTPPYRSRPPANSEEFLAPLAPHFSPAEIDQMRKDNEAVQLAQDGDLEVRQDNLRDAVKDYQQALILCPGEPQACYGLGDDSIHRGDLSIAVTYYRQAIYYPPKASPSALLVPHPPVLREFNAFRVLEYARLLSLSGQQEEAQSICRQGAQILNYDASGHKRLKLILPDFGDGPDQITFTPRHLQALAQTGWAEDHSDFDQPGARARLQQAVAFFPNSPVPYFYRAMYEARSLNDFKAASADFNTAAHIGDAAAREAVRWEQDFYRDFLPLAVSATARQKRLGR